MRCLVVKGNWLWRRDHSKNDQNDLATNRVDWLLVTKLPLLDLDIGAVDRGFEAAFKPGYESLRSKKLRKTAVSEGIRKQALLRELYQDDNAIKTRHYASQIFFGSTSWGRDSRMARGRAPGQFRDVTSPQSYHGHSFVPFFGPFLGSVAARANQVPMRE